jgi:hypothetical protein
VADPTPVYRFWAEAEPLWNEDYTEQIGEAWLVSLPHQCGAWAIVQGDVDDWKYGAKGPRSRREAIADLDVFIAEAQAVRNELAMAELALTETEQFDG